MSPASILPITAPVGAPTPPPSVGRPTLHQMLSQLLIAVTIPVAFDLLSNKLDVPSPNSLFLYEFYAALVIFVLFAAILLFWLLSSASVAATAASDEGSPDWLVHWVHGSACLSLFVAFMLRFSFQVPLESFLLSCLIFMGILVILVAPPLLSLMYLNSFKLRFRRFCDTINP